MPAKGQQGATVENGFRVFGRLALLVHPHARRQRVALARSYLHVAVGNGAGGQVENDRVAISARCSKGNRVSPEQGFLRAVGHHAGHAVDHAQGHQAFFGKRLDIGPECREVMGVTNRQHRNPGTAGFFHQQLAGGCQRRLGKAPRRIHANKPCGDVFNHRHRLAIDPVAGQRRQIARNAEHAMTVGAIPLCPCAVIGQYPGNLPGCAMTLENSLQQSGQFGEGKRLRGRHSGAPI